MSLENQNVKVIHGINDGVFPVAGITVAVIRASLLDAFNISADAIAFVNGVEVESSFLLSPDDVLEFVARFGSKGLGDLLSPEDLMLRWRINADQYRELLDLGLPLVKFKDGTTRHPEIRVDLWWKTFPKELADHDEQEGEEGVGDNSQWFHPASDAPPESHPFGPLEGTQKEIASWLYPDGKPDRRRLIEKANSKSIWGKKINKRKYEVWFRTQNDFDRAVKFKEARSNTKEHEKT